MFAGYICRTHPKIVLNHSISQKMLYPKQCASEIGSSHLMMIYARNWRFRLNTEQTAIILSSVLHNMVSNSTVFCAFLVRRFTVLLNIQFENVIVLMHAMHVRLNMKIAFRLT